MLIIFPVAQASDLADEERKLLKTLESKIQYALWREQYTFMSICYDTWPLRDLRWLPTAFLYVKDYPGRSWGISDKFWISFCLLQPYCNADTVIDIYH